MFKGWRWALGLVGVVGLTVGGVYGWKAWEAEWARRNPEAARIARYEKVFDAAWKAVDENYYDPNFDHEHWKKVGQVYRARVKHQTFDAGLYINVLMNLTAELDTSHVSVSMPPELLFKKPAKSASTVQAEVPIKRADPLTEACPDKPSRNDFGFDLARVRRGGDTRMVIVNVRRWVAEQHGVAPGDLVRDFRVANPRTGCPRLSATLVRGDGRPFEVSYELLAETAYSARARADLPSGVRVLRFDEFDTGASDWLEENLTGAPSKGVILDLRGNYGGQVSVKKKVAGYFLDEGETLGSAVRRGEVLESFAPQSATSYRGPLVVLIGPMSASAAEITAYVLRYHRRAKLIGAETQGAVLTSRSFPLPDGGSVDVAIADYLTPDRGRLEGVGVKPDLPVTQTLETIRAGRDLPLEAAEKALLEGRWRP